MNTIYNYDEYISNLREEITSSIYAGEQSVLDILEVEATNIPIGQFYVWDTICDSEVVLLKVEYHSESLRILEGVFMENALVSIVNGFGINNLDEAIRWWNLCYFRDKEGTVKYDSFYENFYAANETENKISDLNKALEKWIEDSFADVKGLICVLGDLSNCNPIIYQLQQRGLEVKTVSIPNSENVSEFDNRKLQLREQLAVPYCDADIVNMNFLTSDGVGNSPAECHRSYLITIPIDLIRIDDNALGSFSYKDILPSEEFCRDYSCCGHDYAYLEMELFADLHGNTVLKTTNSKADSKYTIINRFNYTNLQKDGESN